MPHSPITSRPRRRWRQAAFTAMLAAAPLAHAQLRLPSLPNLPTLPAPTAITQPLRRDIAALPDLVRQRAGRIAGMLREHRELIEADPNGDPVVRRELVLTSPTSELVAAARAEGFTVVRQRFLDALELEILTLGAPAGWDTRRALQRLRDIDPQATVDFNHLYLESGDAGTPRPSPAPVTSTAGPGGLKVGLVDAGVETGHPLLRGAAIRAWGCGGRKVASAHGTAVASLMVGRAERFRSSTPGTVLYAADVYCNDPVGGSVEAVAAALAWLLEERVPVVNISLVGPANRTLELVVKRAAAKGMLLVAAVGNDGPAAPPLYPAAYLDVVAVTAVDARGQVLPEACRGPHVAFAAPGADMAVAALGTGVYTTARGTSFAAPLVAGLLAAALREPDPAAARLAVAALARQAADQGQAGRDVVYGHGLVARDLRTEPSLVLSTAP